MKTARLALYAFAALAIGGCATSIYQLTLMPRTSGALHYGEAIEEHGATQAQLSITIDGKRYSGSWVQTAPGQTTAYVAGGTGWRRAGIGGSVTVDNPTGGEAKALLQAADGSGLRCDLQGMGSGRSGGGVCQDDKGAIYDVQIRLKEGK